MKLGVLSDIHEDYENLKRSIKIFEKKNCDEIVSLGDVCGFSVPYYGFYNTRSASKCLAAIKDNCKHIIIGNHDLYSINKLPIHKAGINYPENYLDLDYHEKIEFAKNAVYVYEKNSLNPLLTSKDKDFIESLNEYKVFSFDGIKILISHYVYPNLPGTRINPITEISDLKEHYSFMNENNSDLSFSGHAHINGAWMISQNKINKIPFGKRMPLKETKSIISPAMANGKTDNGILIFDSKEKSLEVIPLKSKKHIVPKEIVEADKKFLFRNHV